MTKEQKDKIIKLLTEDIRDYERECGKRIVAEQGKVIGAGYMLHRLIEVIETEYEPLESEETTE